MRYRVLPITSVLLGAAIVFACSYGNYDGNYPGDGGDAGSAEAGTVVLTQTVEPNGATLQTRDGALEVKFAGGTFSSPAKVVISRLADRTLVENLIVPVYAISADKDPELPFSVALRGQNPNPGPNKVLVVVQADAQGAFKPSALVGQTNNGGGGVFWGLSRRLGTFSLFYEPLLDTTGFFDLIPDSCLAKCCPANGGGVGPVSAIGGSCLCTGEPNLSCFIDSCVPNVAEAIARCVEIGNTPKPTFNCKPSMQPCMAPGACCISGASGQCLGNPQGTPGGGCSGITIRCDSSKNCAAGTKCCVFDNEAYCASSCPNERTWCDAPGDCDGGTCTPTSSCPHGTCGTPPAACN